MQENELTPEEKYLLLTPENQEIVKNQIERLIASQSENQQLPCSSH